MPQIGLKRTIWSVRFGWACWRNTLPNAGQRLPKRSRLLPPPDDRKRKPNNQLLPPHLASMHFTSSTVFGYDDWPLWPEYRWREPFVQTIWTNISTSFISEVPSLWEILFYDWICLVLLLPDYVTLRTLLIHAETIRAQEEEEEAVSTHKNNHFSSGLCK